MTNRKSTTGFPMSYRWSVYVTVPLSPQRVAQKATFVFFQSNSLLMVHRYWCEEQPFNLKFSPKVTHPLIIADRISPR